MLLEKKREEEFAKRKGSTKKTIIQTIWLAISAVGGYFFVDWLNSSGTLTYTSLYGMGLPRSVPEWGIMVGLILGVVIVMQLVFTLGYVLGSPAGREKRNQASLHSYNDHVADNNDYDDF